MAIWNKDATFQCRELKYIIFNDETAVFFNYIIDHAKMAEGFHKSNIKSAGFCKIFKDDTIDNGSRLEVSSWGQSTSLNIKGGQADDNDILERNLNEFLY